MFKKSITKNFSLIASGDRMQITEKQVCVVPKSVMQRSRAVFKHYHNVYLYVLITFPSISMYGYMAKKRGESAGEHT